MSFLELDKVVKSYSALTVIHGVSLKVEKGEFVVERGWTRALAAGAPVTVGLRPDGLAIRSDTPVLRVGVDFHENFGGQTQIYASGPQAASVAVVAHGRPTVTRGERLDIGLGAARAHLFDADGVAI